METLLSREKLKIDLLRCYACGKELEDFENEGFCYECFTTYASYSLPDIEEEVERILNDIE